MKMTHWMMRMNRHVFDEMNRDLCEDLFENLHASHDWIVVVNWDSLVYYECYPPMVHSRNDSLLGWGDAQFQGKSYQIGRFPLTLSVFREIGIDRGGGDDAHIRRNHNPHAYVLKSCTNSHHCWRY